MSTAAIIIAMTDFAVAIRRTGTLERMLLIGRDVKGCEKVALLGCC